MNEHQARNVLDGAAKARDERALVEGAKLNFIDHILNASKGCLGEDSTPSRSLKLRDISFD